MAGGLPIYHELAAGRGYGQSSDSQGTAVTSPTAANTKGAWVQLTSSTAADACFVVVQALTQQPSSVVSTSVWTAAFSQAFGPLGGVTSSAATAVCVDIGLGSGGNEVALISNVVAGGMGGETILPCVGHYTFPLEIPAGTRISARAQANSGNAVAFVCIQAFDGTFTAGATGQAIDTYGFNTTTTFGTAIDAGVTLNTKGSWVTLAASTSYDLAGFLLAFDVQGDVTSAAGSQEFLLDVGLGVGGSERVILPDLYLTSYRNVAGGQLAAVLPMCSPYYSLPIRAGTRIAARMQGMSNVAGARVLGVTLYGVRA